MPQELHHVLSAEQFDHEQLLELFSLADRHRELLAEPEQRRELATRYVGHQLCSLFYEASTRTRGSFEKAALNFGMGISSTENAKEFSSAAKGETIEDTARVLDGYGYDIVVMRHDETGGVSKAASVCETPIINAGDGHGEHPTQALTDVYTIFREFGRLDNLAIVAGGDLRRGRTAKSLVKLLARYEGNSFELVSRPEYKITDDVKARLDEHGATYEETAEVMGAVRQADVVYWTRMQLERNENEEPDEIEDEIAANQGYIIGMAEVSVMRPKAKLLHPLPRIGEITPEVDDDPRAFYFEQAKNGLYIRMALIDTILQNRLTADRSPD